MPNVVMRLILLSLLSLSCAHQALAVNRCVDSKGKVTYQDSSCPGAAQTREVDTSEAFTSKKKSAGITGQTTVKADPAYATAKGTWRGPAQFQLSVAGVRDQDAHRVVPLVIELRESGEVIGSMSDAGCKVSGLSSQFIGPSAANMDVTLKGCHDKRFNTRFHGNLIVYTANREAKLTLNAIGLMKPVGQIGSASLEAVLKR